MQVILDQEQWEAASRSTLGEVLADISERVYAQSRMITSLSLDQRTITDRDLDAVLLGEPTTKYAQLRASSRTMGDVRGSAEAASRRYAGLLRDEACVIASRFRMGHESVVSLDAWFGQLADYLEFLESSPARSAESRALSVWVQELLQARAGRDLVRLADLLEYELGPRLGA